jgi:methyl-accepting chemotaxis protein
MSDTYTPKTDLSGKAKDVLRDVKAKAAGVSEDLTRAAKDNAAQIGNTAREFASSAQEKVGEAVGQRKSIGADYIGSIAQATQQAAMAFDNDLPQAAQYIRQASEKMQGVADTVRERDVRELVGDVQDFARQQPTLFFGGAVILGFAALRFLKSTPPKQPTAFDARREE